MTWIAIPLTLVAAAVVAERCAVLSMIVARHTGFVDRPTGYKAHAAPTPYLGGAAVLAAVLATVLPPDGVAARFATILVCAATLWLIGTIDDRINLSPRWRVLAEAGVALIIWATGFGFTAFGSDALNLGFTILWIIAIANAFNLMDNIDGACAVLAAISAAAIGTAALVSGDASLGAIAFAVAGACVGFLRYNLSRPARIFLGDGGSVPLGFLIATLALALVRGHGAGGGELFACGLFAGLPVLDSILVVISRRRRHLNVLAGGLDHLTHRLLPKLETPARVVLALGAVQAGVVTVAVVARQIGSGALVASGGTALALGAIAVCVLESPRWAATTLTASLIGVQAGHSSTSELAPRRLSPRIAPERRAT